MILLLLGWNLTLLGVVSILLAAMTGSFTLAMLGLVAGSLGVMMSFALRKTCTSLRCDVPEKENPSRPLDYY